MKWNEKLKLLRKQKKLTQEDVAELCSVIAKTYWNWENGKKMPSKNNKKALALAFNIPVSEIFKNEELEDDNDIEKIVLSVDYTTAKKLYEQLSKKI